jgi:hypothetical protein
VDWFVFDPQPVLIREIRPYVAAPVHPDMTRQEMQGFDYAGRGYPLTRVDLSPPPDSNAKRPLPSSAALD